jgi:tRNA G18 (ribose-2'-O)-methylase SpoU
MAATAGFDLHRGLVAVAARPAPAHPTQIVADAILTPSALGGPPLIAVLEGLNDAENIGAIFRNAAAFGVTAVLLDPTSGDPLYRRSVRVSVGHVLHVPFARLSPWPTALDQLRSAGFLVAALAPAWRAGDGPPALPVSELAARRPAAVALLLGAEGPGLSSPALDAADVIVSIPMAPGVDSLNVATAAAIAFQMLSHSRPEDS